MTPEQHNQHHYYGYHQNYMDISQQQQALSQQQHSVDIVDNGAELWAAQQSCFNLSNDSIHSSISHPGKMFLICTSFLNTMAQPRI